MFNHLDSHNNPTMVDVSSKDRSVRVALACGKICMSKQAYQAVLDNQVKKGPVLQTAIIAAIMGAKQTSALIPMCHPLPLAGIHVDIVEKEEECAFILKVRVKCQAQTGVEMEALSGVSVGLLTIYDMVKGLDKSMTIQEIYLEHKSGGKNGEYFRNKE
ncbi:cyclic pyranopterin monophosphate synthase MoaC [Helicobacter felis]|uniref:cyclic pyranopterin monophosphate synthase n=1 Tax=Helicobacter felis (strain ATCC 49179 / CCUG 28539 / NCTC 12436 / CS1) TaxID=936155 RepID=E7AA73_HELFC|nr:cyclic pyranopterin monophosphate synthase MoaC [Helicobacter felis]CBY82645.1 molybdenum cofactor biosynthesis protein C [Helicobacter felis ATCC 49179]